MSKIKSPSFSIDSVGIKKVGKGFLIGVVGLAVTALEGLLPFVNFGELWTPIAVVVNSAIVNLIRKWSVSY